MNYITGFELVYRKFDETTGELLGHTKKRRVANK